MRTPVALSLAFALLTAFAHAAPSCSTLEHRLGPYDDPRPYQNKYSESLHLGYVTSSHGKSAAVVDGKQGPWYDEIHDNAVIVTESGRFAYEARRGSHWLVVLDGTEGPEYDAPFDYPVFSRDGRRVACILLKGTRHILVVDGRETAEAIAAHRQYFAFSTFGHRLACAVRVGARQAMLVDGRVGPAYDEVWPDFRGFSYDGRHFGYVARNGSKYFAVVDGVAGPPYDIISQEFIYFSYDSRHVIYTAGRGREWFPVVDGIERCWPGWESAYFCEFSPDGRHSAYLLRKGDIPKHMKIAYVVDGVVGPEYDDGSEFVFSPDSRHFAYAVLSGGSDLVVRDGVEGPRFSSNQVFQAEIRDLRFSPDSRRLAYSVPIAGKSKPMTPDKRALVVDGIRGPTYAGFSLRPQFTSDSRHFAYSAEKGEPAPLRTRLGDYGSPPKRTKSVMVVDGAEGPEYDDIQWPSPYLGPLSWPHVTYAARKAGKWFLVKEGVEGPAYDAIERLTLSPDTRHIAYEAKRGQRWMMVIDGAEGLRYDEILAAQRLGNDGAIDFLAADAGTLYRVHQSLPTTR